MKTKPYDPAEHLKSEAEIALYLDFCAEESAEAGDQRILLTALETAAKARGMMQIAQAAGVSRESLYRSLAPDAKPRFETIAKVLDALGLRLAIVPKENGITPESQ